MKPRTPVLIIMLIVALAACGGGKTAATPTTTTAPGPASSASPLDSNTSSTTGTTIPTTTTTTADQDKQAVVAAAKNYLTVITAITSDPNASADDPRLDDVVAEPAKSPLVQRLRDFKSKGLHEVRNDDISSAAVTVYALPTATAVLCLHSQGSQLDASGKVVTPSSLPDRGQETLQLQKGADGKWRTVHSAYQSNAC